MLINETKYDIEALKNLNTLIAVKSRVYVAIFQALIGLSGVLLFVLNIGNTFMQILGGIIVFGAVVAFCVSMFGWQKLADKQIDKIAKTNPYLINDVVERFEFDENNETVTVSILQNGAPIAKQTYGLKNLVKVVENDSYIFLYITPKQCVFMKKTSMLEGESWEIELLLKRVLNDRYIQKKSR